MIQLIKTVLLLLLDDINSGNTNIDENQLLELIQILLKINAKELSKIEAAKYIGVSRATFDNYINRGLIPKGQKRQGFKELSWNKYDLDKFLKSNIK